MAKVRQTNTTRFLEAPFVRMLRMRSANLKKKLNHLVNIPSSHFKTFNEELQLYGHRMDEKVNCNESTSQNLGRLGGAHRSKSPRSTKLRDYDNGPGKEEDK